ncbi:MAG: hypothetical protein HPY59_16470 [Anaerolineae bacterium]|nr:hypothetical protein [Anaerolineae bacterium]
MSTDQIALLVNRRRRRGASQKHSSSQSGVRIFLAVGSSISLLFVVGLLALGALFAELTKDLPSLETLPVMLDRETGQLLQPTRLYDRSGQTLLVTLENPGETRRFLSIDPQQAEFYSPQLLQIVLSLYDPSFWQHPGFAYWDIANPQPLTLAERLVDALLLEAHPAGLRKTLQMRFLAGQVVARYGRSQVLEWFLNSSYFGHLAYGADSAAQLYLGKPASQLTLAEAALLAGLLESPALNPIDAPVAARDEQHKVLERLLLLGAINQQEFDEASAFDLTFQAAAPVKAQTAHAFTRLALEQLAQIVGERRVERGGLKIITTLDSDLQKQLACTVQSQLQRLQETPGSQELSPDCPAARLLPTLPPAGAALPNGLTASAVVLDVQSGDVLALVGDISLKGEQSSLTSHPPGTLLSPFIALSGFTRGMGPASLVWDIPTALPPGLAGYSNPDGIFHGPQRLRLAVANDYLAAMTRLMLQVGPETVWRMAEPLGLSGLSDGQERIGLLYDGGAVSPLSIAQAYNVFANLGNQPSRLSDDEGKAQPGMVLSVEELNGRKLMEDRLLTEQAVLSPPLAYLVHSILSDESARWPSLGYPNPLEIGRPAGARVGRTATRQELWTVGYTTDILAVVWLGWPKGVESAPLDVRMPSGIWHAFMQYAHRDKPVRNWDMPPEIATIRVCDPSGKLPTPDCPSVVTEVFLRGTEPTGTDDLYRAVQVNRETGLLATVFTPLELIENRVYLFVPPEAQGWAKTAGLAPPPTDYDTIQVPPSRPDVKISSPQTFSYVRDQVEVKGTAAGEGFVSYRVQIGEGLNPKNWIQLGDEESKPVREDTLARWNTRGQEGLYAVQLLVLRQDQRVDSAVIQVTVDNTPPEARITYPVAGQEFDSSDGRPIIFQTEASDNIALSRLEWYLDGKKAGESSQSSFSLPWSPQRGRHVLALKAFDLAGNSTETSSVEFTVK